MRECLKNRAGFDRVMMAVAATFLTVSATAAVAQDQVRSSAAELAIEAAIPLPEPANVPPPTAADIKLDTTATVQDPSREAVKDAASSAPTEPTKTAAEPAPAKVETKPADVATTPADARGNSTLQTDSAKTESAADTAKTEGDKADPAKSDAAAVPAAAEPTKDVAKQPVSEPVKAASTVPAADQPVADKLKEAIGSKATRYFDRKAERAAVEKFYSAREFAPVWTNAGSASPLANRVIARLRDAASDGLNPADYPVPDFTAATSPDALADAELKLTASMLDYARHAQSGRMHWSQVSGDILYPEHPIDPSEVLANVTTAPDASAALESYNPPHKLYKELKAKLAQLRGQTDGQVITIAEGPSLRYTAARGKKQAEIVVEDPRVPQLRAKLGIAENSSDERYDAVVAEAVRKFQDGADLKPTGVLDSQTVRALNSPKRDKQIDTVVVNMERWRWLPRDLGAPSLGDAYVILNIPDFTLKVMQRGQQVWTTRVVTGKPGTHATPLLTETMKYITVNPTWNVPPSIVYNEYLPALQQDPTVLQRMGLRLEQNRDGSVHISQPPGEANALGRIRFNFPNKFLVYQHDTPDKHLFAKEERAFSHGCMRVQNPDQYASVLLNITMPNERYTPERIRSMYGSSEVDLKFPTPIPINITYQTAFVDDGGKLQFRKDIYGRDATMIALLKNTRGKDLENVVAHSQPSYSRPATTLPSGVTYANNGGGGFSSSGPNFFERLFGAPTPPPAPTGRRQRVFTR